MDADINRLMFLDDPTMYQAQADEVCAYVPAGLSTAEDLIDILKEGLGLPEYCGHNWNALSDVLRYWGDWRTTPRRVVILHNDLPFLHMGKNGRLNFRWSTS